MKMEPLVQKSWPFSLSGGRFLLVEMHRKESANNGAIRSSFSHALPRSHTVLKCDMTWENFEFSPTRPHWAELVIESSCPWLCVSVCANQLPREQGFLLMLRASHWPSDHMTRSRQSTGGQAKLAVVIIA